MEAASQYAAEAERVRQRIDALRRSDTLVFPIFTDLHTRSLDAPVTLALFDAMEALSKAVRADAVIALGDNLAMLGREEHASNETIHAIIRGLFERVSSLWPCPLLPVNGNHDGIGTDFFKAGFWQGISRGFDRGAAQRVGESAYYTVDFDRARVRIIVLSLPSGSDLTAENPSPTWAFGGDQLKWLAETALRTDYQALLVCHVPLYYAYADEKDWTIGVWTGDHAAQSYVSALCGWIDDRDEAEALLSAFNAHAACRIDRLNVSLPASPKSAGLIACLSGHMHDDSLFRAGETIGDETNRLPCAQIQSGSTNVSLNRPLRDQAALPISMDVAVLTPSERRLTMVRYGAGADRTVRW